MPRSHHPRSLRTSTLRTSTSAAAQNPVNLGLQVAKQLITLFGGAGTGGAALGFSPLGGSGSNSATAVITSLTSILTSLQTAETANTAALTANTAALGGRLSGLLGGGGGGGGGGGLSGLLGGNGLLGDTGASDGGGFFGGLSSLLGGFGGLLGIASLGRSLFNVFGGSSAPKQTLTPYIAPFAQLREVADTSGFPSEDQFADGSPRSYDAPGTSSAQPLQVTVNVSAMDSQSFMDNAPVLAEAVRQAMLNMNPINQMIRESL